MSEILQTPSHVPHEKTHWILRVVSERHHPRVMRIGLVFGAICRMIWMLAAFAGLFLGPILFFAWRPSAPISQPILWLRNVSGSNDAFLLSYTIAMITFISVIRAGCSFVDYINKSRNA